MTTTGGADEDVGLYEAGLPKQPRFLTSYVQFGTKKQSPQRQNFESSTAMLKRFFMRRKYGGKPNTSLKTDFRQLMSTTYFKNQIARKNFK